MLAGMERQRLRPVFSRWELVFITLGLACLAGQAVVYHGPHPSTAARIAVVVLGVGAFGFMFAIAGSIIRRARAQERRSAE